MDAESSPWMTGLQAIDYLSHGERTVTGRRKHSKQWLAKQVQNGKLKAARVSRGELLFRREWLDEFVTNCMTPVIVMARRTG
jgi:hypothetical protein